MASFRDRLNKTEGAAKKGGSFRDRLNEGTEPEERSVLTGKTTFKAIPIGTTQIEEQPPIATRKPELPSILPTERPSNNVPSLRGERVLSPRATFAKETIVEDTRIKEEKKAKELQRKKNLSGAEERLANLIKESDELGKGPEFNFTREKSLTDDILKARNLITANQPGFKSGALESLGFDPTAKFGAQKATPERQIASEKAIEEAREQKGFTTGKVFADISKQAIQYATVGAAAKGLGLTSKIVAKLGGASAPFIADQLVDLGVDIVVQAPREWKEALTNDKTLGADLLDMLGNRGWDVLINGVIGNFTASGKAAREQVLGQLKKAFNKNPQLIEAVAKNVDSNKLKSIQNELGLPEGTTAKDFLEQQTKEFQAGELDDALKEFDKTPNDIFNDFQDWRSKNFGGATGRVEQSELDTLKQLYKEDTGIDLDVALKEVGGGITPLTKSQGEIAIEQLKATAPEFPARTGEAFASAPGGVPKTFRERLNVSTKVEPDAVKALDEQPIKEVLTPEARVVEPIVTPEVGPKLISPEIPKVETKLDTPTIEPVASSRIPDIPTPEVGESKSPFVERVSEFLKGDQTVSKIKKDLDNFDKLPTTTDAARETMAKQVVKDDFDGSLRMAMEGKQFGNRVESNIALLLADELQRTGRHAEQVELISKMSEKFRAAGQDVQSAKAWAKTSPEGMKKWATDTLETANVDVDPKLIAEIGDDMKLINEMTPEQLGAMVAKRLGKVGETKFIQNQILNSFSFDQLKGTNTALTMQKVFDKIPIVKAKKLSSLQAMSHLLNFRTFSRNILGNTASIAAETVNKIPSSIADRGLKAFTGNRSVVADMPKLTKQMKEQFKEGFKQGQRSFFEITSGVSKGNQGKYDLLFGSAFKGKTGKALEKVMGISLQSTDEFFKGFTKVDSLYNQLQARIGKEVKDWNFEKVMSEATEAEVKTALDEASFVTFQNDSALAGILSKSKKFANEISEHIPGTVFTKDFGLGDLIVKYTRVPGNIITRGVEYSPVGYLKAVHDASKIITEGTNAPVAMQRQVAQALGRATTGSGLIAIGGFLRNQGIITGVDNTKDWDVNAFNNAEGVGNYRINIDALERLIKGGNPEKQKGDTLKSYNWAAPMTTPIAIGARLAGEDANLFSVEGAKLLTAATMDEALDLPTLSIIKKMQFEGMKGESESGNKMLDIASVPIKEAIPSIVPSIVRQTAQAIDPTFRDSSAKSTIPLLPKLVGDKLASRIQSNIPAIPGIPEEFTSKGLPPKLDPLGRTSQREGGAFGALVDPASTSTFKPTGFGDTLRKISELSDKTTVFPDRKPPKSFTSRGNVIQLTEEEKRLWQQTEGQEIQEKYTKFLKGKTVDTEAEAIKLAKILETIKKRAGEKAKTTILKGRR